MTHKFPALIVLTLAATALAQSTRPSDEPWRKPGPHQVQTMLVDWRDQARNRDIPAKVYYPKADKGPFPVVLFSHGLGGSRQAAAYLGQHWASHGYVSVHLQHPGSDNAVWQNQNQPMDQMRKAAGDPSNALNRPLDVSFAIDQLEKMNAGTSPLAGRLDMKKLGMAGHSFGAYTTMAIAGQVFVGIGGRQRNLADPRVKAAIPMSAPVPKNRDLDTVYGSIKIPILHMTGTLDDSPIGDTKAADRRLPFDHGKGPDRYLIIFQGGDHMIFSGRSGLRGNRAKDDVFHDLIRLSTTAFWDAYLKDDPAARTFLVDGLAAALGKDATLETARPSADGGR